MILLIDNYDSFAHNLARYFVRLGAPVHVERNDAVTVEQIQQWRPPPIVLSPGPCTPQRGRLFTGRRAGLLARLPDPGRVPGASDDCGGLRRDHPSVTTTRCTGGPVKCGTTGKGCLREFPARSRRVATIR